MTRAELLALAERVENAAGPEIIKEALFAIRAMEREAYLAARRFDDWDRRAERWIGDLQRFAAGAYIDAAASLVPPGLAWTLAQNIHYRHWTASISQFNKEGVVQTVSQGQSATHAAIALTAAALRARAEEAGE